MSVEKETRSEVHCKACEARYFIASTEEAPRFCSYCQAPLGEEEESSYVESQADLTILEEHAPKEKEVLFTIGTYQILEKIAQGGMGEVFIAYDTSCGRKIALKRIRKDLGEQKKLYARFLKEARLTSQLTHPSIIPIYSIHEGEHNIYYTMPYVEGRTLKSLFREIRKREQAGEKVDEIGGTIPTLIRYLVQISQGIAYAHSCGVLHRDIKGENIIVGKFGEVMILDWGLALHEEESKGPKGEKLAGTPSYLAPERVLGSPATKQSDIYSLGVLLYSMLALRTPFIRKSISNFRKTVHKEKFKNPSEVAPTRDVPPLLEQICKRCLSPNPADRYSSVEEFISELESYIEGRSEWTQVAHLDIHEKNDWQFQENVLIAEHTAITQSPTSADWVLLMISNQSFPGNVRLETEIKIGRKGHGIGFLLNVPEVEERRHINDGYTLWIGTNEHPATKLLRSTIEVISQPEVVLEKHQMHKIRIEKIDNSFYFYLDDQLQFSTISHLPLTGTHIGIISRDADFEMAPLTLSTGGESVSVSCLAVPDAFLAFGAYEKAVSEYRRIAYTFPGRTEGRDALFRAGIALLEQAKMEYDPSQKPILIERALEEFEQLIQTHAGPLGYLGKALVYKVANDIEDELRCYMLAFRRYKKHPLLKLLKEQIIFRLHECSRSRRSATYELLYIVFRHLPECLKEVATTKLITNLSEHWETLPFLETEPCSEHMETAYRFEWAIVLSFWMNRPYFVEEIVHYLFDQKLFFPALFQTCLIVLLELHAFDLIEGIESILDEEKRVKEREMIDRIYTPFLEGVRAPCKVT